MTKSFFLFFSFFLFLFCGSEQNEKLKIVKDIDVHKNKFNQININITDRGQLTSKIYGDSLIRKKNPYNEEVESEFFNHMLAIFYDKQGNVSSTVKADYSKVNEKTNFMFMKGNVYIETAQLDTIRCKDLTWDNITRLFTTKDSISINTPKEKLKGVGLEANSDFSNYKIFKTFGKTVTQSFEL